MLTYPIYRRDFVNAKSLLFDGVNQFVDFGDKPDFRFERTDPFSISIWFKTTTASRTLWSKKSSTAVNPGYFCHFHGGSRIEFHLVGSGGGEIDVETTVSEFNDGIWRHVVMAYSGSSLASGVRIYMEGVLQTLTINSDALTASMLNSRVLKAGVVGTSSEAWSGNLDEMSVWGKQLSAGEVTSIYNSGNPNDLIKTGISNLTSWWRMGDGDIFPTITDNVGNNDGTMTNMLANDIVSDVP